jgi:hypothetical protein
MTGKSLHCRNRMHMKEVGEKFILGSALVMILLTPFHAQTATATRADSNAPSASPSSESQAPDEMTKKITELVHIGKYAEAQQLTTGLLIAYPNDQRLIKAKAVIEKLLARAGSAHSAPKSNQPTNAVVPAQHTLNTSVEQLTGMDKVDYNALLQLAQQAQQTSDLDEQKTLLQQFMNQSSTFLQKHSDQVLIWQLRGASAISLNDPMAGYEAGEKLLAVGAADSSDSNLQGLLGQLKNKGWLEEEWAE